MGELCKQTEFSYCAINSYVKALELQCRHALELCKGPFSPGDQCGWHWKDRSKDFTLYLKNILEKGNMVEFLVTPQGCEMQRQKIKEKIVP